eukprot:14791036-Alexandrium_andersonii.AAC.1
MSASLVGSEMCIRDSLRCLGTRDSESAQTSAATGPIEGSGNRAHSDVQTVHMSVSSTCWRSQKVRSLSADIDGEDELAHECTSAGLRAGRRTHA